MIYVLLGAITYLAIAILVTVALKALKTPFTGDEEIFGLAWPITALCAAGMLIAAGHRRLTNMIAKGFGL